MFLTNIASVKSSMYGKIIKKPNDEIAVLTDSEIIGFVS